MSAAGNSFEFAGIDFGDASYNCYATVRELPRLPRPRVHIDSYAQADGAATQGATYEPARIVLECAIVGTNASNVETLVANTAAALALTQQGPSTLIIDLLPTKAWTARLVSGMDGALAQTGETFTLEFLCADPWPRATSATNTTGNIAGGGVTSI